MMWNVVAYFYLIPLSIQILLIAIDGPLKQINFIKISLEVLNANALLIQLSNSSLKLESCKAFFHQKPKSLIIVGSV